MFQNRISFALLLFVVVAAPFFFGSTDPLFVLAWCAVLGLALALCNPTKLRENQYGPVYLFLFLALAILFVVHEQLAAHPLLAGPYPLWSEAEKALGEKMPASAAIARNQAWYALGNILLVMLTLAVSFVVNTDRERARTFFRTIAWAGAVYAAFSIVAFIVAPGKVLWRDKQGHLSALTGTFTNRNTAADFFGTFSVLWLLLCFEEFQKIFPLGRFRWRDLMYRLKGNMSARFLLPAGMLFLCLVAMFLTASRAGVMVSIASMVLAIVCVFGRLISKRGKLLGFAAAAAAVFFVLLQVMGAGLVNRFDLDGIVDSSRESAYAAIGRMIRDHPWIGTGLGTFEFAFPAYRTADISMYGTWNRAHNTLLELAAELGIPLALFILLSWLFVVVTIARGVTIRRRDAIFPIAGLSVALLGLLHSMVDFSLQIPGYAILFAAVVGLGLAQAYPSRNVRTVK